jgi:hypothetical protein
MKAARRATPDLRRGLYSRLVLGLRFCGDAPRHPRRAGHRIAQCYVEPRSARTQALAQPLWDSRRPMPADLSGRFHRNPNARQRPKCSKERLACGRQVDLSRARALHAGKVDVALTLRAEAGRLCGITSMQTPFFLDLMRMARELEEQARKLEAAAIRDVSKTAWAASETIIVPPFAI